MAGDILHFAQAFFLEFRVAHRKNFIHDQNLVCAPPGSQSPPGLPAAPLTCIVPDAAPFGPTFVALPLAFPSFRFLRAAPALRFSLPHTQNRAIQENILICASPPALHPSGQPAVALTPGRPAFCFTPWPVKCEAYFTGLR